MAGLVGYASSDDEEEAESLQQTVSVPKVLFLYSPESSPLNTALSYQLIIFQAPVTVPNTAEPRNQVKEQTTTTTTSDDRGKIMGTFSFHYIVLLSIFLIFT